MDFYIGWGSFFLKDSIKTQIETNALILMELFFVLLPQSEINVKKLIELFFLLLSQSEINVEILNQLLEKQR